MGPADGLLAGFGKTPVGDLPLPDEVSHHPGHLLNGDIGVGPVLVIEVDVVGPQPTERGFHRRPDHLRAGIRYQGFVDLRAGLVKANAEFCGDDHSIPAVPEGLAHQGLVLVGVVRGAVNFGGVKEGIACLRRLADEPHRLLLLCGGTVGVGKAHAPKAHRRNHQIFPKDSLTHSVYSSPFLS